MTRRYYRSGQLARCLCGAAPGEPLRVLAQGYSPTLNSDPPHVCERPQFVPQPRGPQPQRTVQHTVRIPVALSERALERGPISEVVTEALDALLRER